MLYSQSKELSSVDVSHSTLHVLLGLLERPSTVRLTCSGCKGSSSAFFFREGSACASVSDPCLPGPVLANLQHVRSRVGVSPSEWLSGMLFLVWGSVWLLALPECWVGPELFLCERWVASSSSSSVLSWLWQSLWWLWLCQKTLLCCSNSESRGRRMFKCISRFSSHSSSFAKEGLKDKDLWWLHVFSAPY